MTASNSLASIKVRRPATLPIVSLMVFMIECRHLRSDRGTSDTSLTRAIQCSRLEAGGAGAHASCVAASFRAHFGRLDRGVPLRNTILPPNATDIYAGKTG